MLVIIDRDKDQVRRRDVTSDITGLIPRLRSHPDANLARRTTGPVDLSDAGHDVADMHRDDELQFVDYRSNGPAATMARGNYTGRLVYEAHDRATVDIALQVGVERIDDTTEPDS